LVLGKDQVFWYEVEYFKERDEIGYVLHKDIYSPDNIRATG
jgi:hypothetical protein